MVREILLKDTRCSKNLGIKQTGYSKSVPEKLLGEKSILEIKILVLGTHGTDRLISIFTVHMWALLIGGSMLKFFILVFLQCTVYGYYSGY